MKTMAKARQLGARKLYISATPSKNRVDFYMHLGCRLTSQIDPKLYELEPEDIHLELSSVQEASVSKLVADDIPRLGLFVLDAWRLAGPSALGWTGATDENIEEIASESFLQRFIGNPNLKAFISKRGKK